MALRWSVMQSHEANNEADVIPADALGPAGANAADALGDRRRDVMSGVLELGQIGLDVGRGEQRRVLAVDDDPHALMYVRHTLTKAGLCGDRDGRV